MFTKKRKRQDYFVLFYYEGEERIKKNKIKWCCSWLQDAKKGLLVGSNVHFYVRYF